MNSYPYYIPVRVDASVLKKIFKTKKFKTHSDAVNAMVRNYESLSEITGHNSFIITQNAILEYINEYSSNIVTIFTNGEQTIIQMPQKLI